MITLQNVSKTIGARPILQDVSFTVPDGSITGFVGPNGAGKTTTMRIALGLTRADTGIIRFNSIDYVDLPAPLREVGSLIDAGALFPNLRARHVLDYCARTQGMSLRSAELLSLVGLAEAGNRRVRHLSLGMRQRLGIAVALIASPRHLILDEPLNGLDPSGIGWLRDLLRRLRSEGCSILLSSHIISELALIADDVVVITEGRIVLNDSLEQLAVQGPRSAQARTDRPADLIAAIEAQHGSADHVQGEPVTITGMTAREVSQLAASQGIVLDELTEVQRTLDDIYRDAVGDANYETQEKL